MAATYDFYVEKYMGISVPENLFPVYAREASALIQRYKRIYTVRPLCEEGELLAECAVADTLYYYAWAENGGGAASVSIGSVSSSRGQQAQPDLSPKAKSRELYRVACQYLDIYRGPDGRQ